MLGFVLGSEKYCSEKGRNCSSHESRIEEDFWNPDFYNRAILNDCARSASAISSPSETYSSPCGRGKFCPCFSFSHRAAAMASAASASTAKNEERTFSDESDENEKEKRQPFCPRSAWTRWKEGRKEGKKERKRQKRAAPEDVS